MKLDCSRIKKTFGWRPRWNIRQALEKTVEWSKAYLDGKDVSAVMDQQIRQYGNN